MTVLHKHLADFTCSQIFEIYKNKCIKYLFTLYIQLSVRNVNALKKDNFK